ncbi:class I SAM-dependent methyltransferase [Novosphingobium sp.]|uniref:class I SAM-dependent methyltransferase n=1 Tax=Novosphingobium sp. TaxID=1874826 RepID=UPI001EC05260|nr:class I SAM-dependent methyltransferase [Novosphingobium sp.]MBK9011496.1 class I SAM-dependent methyltransferase [Novosphingobium sp.]
MDPAAEHRDRLEPLRMAARLVPGGMALGRWLRRTVDPDLREIARLRHAEAGQLFQPFPDTSEDRYPTLFDALAERLADLEAPRLLSFGCSSGAEVRALRRRLPLARITGIDLNRRALGKARAADRDPRSVYRQAAAPDPGERFDAVLAMAVFRHGELEARRPASCSTVLPFARFAEGIAALDEVLEPGGWLAIGNAHFRFADTPAAANYEADPLRIADAPPQALLYGPDDRQLAGVTEPAVLFRKHPA